MDHAINITHDGTLIIRIPKGYEVDKVVVEEMGTENRKKFVHMPADISDYCDELWEKAYERGKAEIIRCKDCKSWGRLVTYKDGSTMIDCKKGRSISPEGYCHLAELRGEANG